MNQLASTCSVSRQGFFEMPYRKPVMAFFGTILLIALFALGGCGHNDTLYPEKVEGGKWDPNPDPGKKDERLFGEGGLNLFGGRGGQGGAPAGIGVNGFLWRASLDTLAFMPLASADPFGGVIITDWHSDASSPNERFKMTVYILDQQLRADGLRVAVFRQARNEEGNWADASVNPETALKLENAILTRARQLRINTLEASR
jgi:hypothetical protein